jgi:hypothetical protein
MTDPIDVRYLFRMTDDTGIFQHAVLGVPDPSEGYTSDDNARALVLAAMLYERFGEQRYEELMVRYLAFLLHAEKGRWFRNFMGYGRKFTEKRGSEDCFGRCLLALGYTVSRTRLPESVRGCAEKLLRRTVSSCSSLNYPKGKAYAAVGLSLWNTPDAQPYLEMLRESLADTYVQCRRENWRWFEEKITYCSAVLPLAMLCMYGTGDSKQEIGPESLTFLTGITFRDGLFTPVGCKGWMKHGGEPAVYDEQPVEACNMMLACLKAYDITGNGIYLEQAKQCFFWYLGRNIGRASMIDPETGGCRDGLTRCGLNKNEGAESLVCWLTAALLAEQNGWYPTDEILPVQSMQVLWL